MGGFLGSKRIDLCFPESTVNYLNHLGMESPFSQEGKLPGECIGCMVELPQNMNGTQRFELHRTPKEEFVGEL